MICAQTSSPSITVGETPWPRYHQMMNARKLAFTNTVTQIVGIMDLLPCGILVARDANATPTIGKLAAKKLYGLDTTARDAFRSHDYRRRL